MYLKKFLEYKNEVKRRGAQSSLHNKHTHLVIEKHVDCKWIDAERDGDDKRNKERKKDNKQTNHHL